MFLMVLWLSSMKSSAFGVRAAPVLRFLTSIAALETHRHRGLDFYIIVTGS